MRDLYESDALNEIINDGRGQIGNETKKKHARGLIRPQDSNRLESDIFIENGTHEDKFKAYILR